MIIYWQVTLLLILSAVDCLSATTKLDSEIRSDIKLIKEASRWFKEGDVDGFEELVRKWNDSQEATFFTSVHMPDHIIRHDDIDDEGQELVVLPADPVTVKVPFKNVTTYIVLRLIPSLMIRYTSHLAYVRKFGGETSVEWDIYSLHYHAFNNGSFISAFFPVRGGPDTIQIGLGFTLTRSRRGETGGYNDADKELSLLSTQLGKPHKRLQWSMKSTMPSVVKLPLSDMKAAEDATTEFPIYGDSLPADEYGFTTPPPWSQYRLQESSTVSPMEDSIEIVPKRLCFGLHNNCGEKHAPKQKLEKACLFGLRCKESFVDRFAVKTTSTMTPLQDDNKPEKITKKYNSLEECTAAEMNIRGRSMSLSRNFTMNKIVNNTLSHELSSQNKTALKSKFQGRKKGSPNDNTISNYRKNQIAEELKKIRVTASVKNISLSIQGIRPSSQIPIEKKLKLHKIEKRSLDPCAEFRSEGVRGESLMKIEEGISESVDTLLSNFSNRVKSIEGHNKMGNVNETIQLSLDTHSNLTMTPAVKEAINPFTNSLNVSTPNADSSSPPWEDAIIDIIDKNLLFPEIIIEEKANGSENLSKTPESIGPETEIKREYSTDPEEALERMSKNETELLDVDEASTEPNLKIPKPKIDSDQEDVDKLNSPYIGVGTCAYVKLDDETYPTEIEDLIDRYLKVLKVQCLPEIRSQTIELFHELVQLNESRISLNFENKFYRKKTLGETEWMDLASAVALSFFSQVYQEQYEAFGKLDNKPPNKNRLSGTVKTLTLLVFKILESLHSKQKQHAIKFANVLLVIVQAQRSELVAQVADIEKCTKCLEEKQVNFNDQIQLYAIMRFIVDKLSEIVSSSTYPETMFTNFYDDNLSKITELVKNKTPFVY